MLLNKIKKTKNRFRAYPTHQAVQTSGSTAVICTMNSNPSSNTYIRD